MANILVVEDDRKYAELYESALKEDGHVVKIANNAQIALISFKDFSPDLVILDILMPVEDGFSVLAAIKSHPFWKDVPVIIVSNLSDPKQIEAGKKLGANEFIVKANLSLDELKKKVNLFLPKEN